MKTYSEQLKKQIVAEYIKGEKRPLRSYPLSIFPKATYIAGRRNMHLKNV